MKTTTVKTVYGAESEGCWFDNCRGYYLGEEVILVAIRDGFDTDLGGYERYADHPDYLETWDDAERFMSNFAAPGFWFGSNDSGDWGLWASEDEA